MADEIPTTTEGAAPVVEFRPCTYCGESIHPSSHRCVHCGGHVGLSWGTVHTELFLFLFLSLTMAIACLVSWTGRTPVASASSLAKAQDTALADYEAGFRRQEEEHRLKGLPPPVRTEVKIDEKRLDFDSVAPTGRLINGLDTLRGSLIFALAAYGVLVSIFNLLYRRLTMWPFVLAGILALWTGLQGVLSAADSAAWARWNTWAESKSMMEQFLGKFRAVAPGHALLTLAGLILMVKLIGGVVAVAAKKKADAPKNAPPPRRPKKDDVASPTSTTPPAIPPPLP